jgi:predicted house-cleaning NTP pyrophosphatase (Maf/HAM1 superfamily)
MEPQLARGGDLGRPHALLTLASTSPQRRAILEQLQIPFEVVAPDYLEHDRSGIEPAELYEDAEGKASSTPTTS